MIGNMGDSSQDPPDSSQQTKLKFKPKIPPKKVIPQLVTTAESSDSDEELQYKEGSIVPMSLPWKRPGAEDPEILDYPENSRNSAKVLGLLEDKDEMSMIFFQLPASLPFEELRKAASEKKESEEEKDVKKGCCLKELPGGLLGKMLIYKSGIVKMKLGDKFIFYVSPGQNCSFQQDAAVIDTKERNCCILGKIDSVRAIITPDIESLLNEEDDDDDRAN